MRRGWTTGACAAAAARAAFAALLTGRFPDPVTIRLPRGQTPNFPLALAEQSARELDAQIAALNAQADERAGEVAFALERERLQAEGVSARAQANAQSRDVPPPRPRPVPEPRKRRATAGSAK